MVLLTEISSTISINSSSEPCVLQRYLSRLITLWISEKPMETVSAYRD